MKKIFEIILWLITITALILGGAQLADGSCHLAWTLSCIAVVAVCGWLWGRYFNPVHIPDDVYVEIQEKIQRTIDTMEDGHEFAEIVAALPDDAAIYLSVEISSHETKIKFRDDAWGATKTFTEINGHRECEITNVRVLDGKGNERESDFDESYLELEFEDTEWI